MAGPPIAQNAGPVVAPLPSSNQQDALGAASRQSTARNVLDMHMAGLVARRQRDLISEKLLLHVDGSGEWQWADVYNGQRIVIPRQVSEFRKQENALRLIVDNAVAHHTTMPLRYFADSLPDRRSRDKALVDSLFANYLAQQQDFNGLFADALYMAMPAGFCPVHAYWRDDRVNEYEPTAEAEMQGPSPGMVDCWIGNPFDTVFNRGARRNSIHWMSYGRLLPASMVRAAFAHVPGAEKIEGSNRIPSASQFQRIARDWNLLELGLHGSSVTGYRRAVEGDDEMVVLVCREVLPGVEADWPDGRLQIVAVPGAVDLRRGQAAGGSAILLADQALPAGDFSASLFYTSHRGDDVHGKPWVEDMDETQVELNIALSKRWEFIEKMFDAPIVAPGGAISDDMADFGGYNLLEVEPSLASWRPRVMEYSTAVLQALNNEVAEKRNSIFTAGGYQAASRGEAPGSRMAYRAILALQQADNTVHGPVNLRYIRSACDFAQRCWKQMKTYGSVPWVLPMLSDEYGFLADSYIDSTKMSDQPPQYKLVNAFGASPELRAQEVLELMQARGADGEAFLTTAEARRQYPNRMIFGEASDPKAVQVRRAKTITQKIIDLAAQFRQQTGYQEKAVNHPWMQQAAQLVFQQTEELFPRLRDDDLMSHLGALSELTQDETADPIARMAATARQNEYFAWQAQMAAPPQAPQQPTAQSPLDTVAALRAGTMALQAAAPTGMAPKIGQAKDRQGVAAQMGGLQPQQQQPEGPSPITATARG